MAEEEQQLNRFSELMNRLSNQQKLSLGVGLSALIALFVGMWIWGQSPDYRVLYSNLSDQDGGAVIAALQQQNIPYKFSDSGTAVLIPSEKIHEVRLSLASQGLPKGGSVGFELMENQKFGTTQFAEQVNYQRALEGELARSVQKIDAVASARVHLAIPKPTVFVKEKQKPRASVIINLQRGRALDPGQVRSIVHLISSSVPELAASEVSVVDQDGNLLSTTPENSNLDTKQIKYVHDLEDDYIKRIEKLLIPIYGEHNIRAQVTADVDFSHVEQTSETYKPNQGQNEAAVRSLQDSQSLNGDQLNPSGVPGALSNQPPVPATAPLVSGAAPTNPATPQTPNAGNIASLQKGATINYEVDRTISHTIAPSNSIRRLSVAVLLNASRPFVDAKGKPSTKTIDAAEQDKVNKLIRDAVGLDDKRGDNLNIQVIDFDPSKSEEDAGPAFWEQFAQPDFVLEALKYLAILIVALVIIFKVIRPALQPLMTKPEPEKEPEPEAETIVSLEEQAEAEDGVVYEPAHTTPAHEQSIKIAKQIVQQDPRIVASVLKEWVNE